MRDRKQVDPTCDTSDGCILCLKPPPPSTHPQSPRKRNPTERRVVFLTNTSFLSGASSSRFVLMATLSQQCWCFLKRGISEISSWVWKFGGINKATTSTNGSQSISPIGSVSPKTDLLPTIAVVSSPLLCFSFILHSETIVRLILNALVYMAIIYSRMLFHGGTWASLSGTVGHMKTQTRSSSAHWAKENIPVKTFVGGQIQARFIAQGKPCRYKAEKMQKGNIG